jgi:ketosteroid isomerase-like protein
MRGALVCTWAGVAFWALSGQARASDPVTAVLDAQSRAIGADDADGFAATFAPDGFALMPIGYATSAKDAGRVMSASWHPDEGDYQAKSASVQTAVIGHAAGVAWVTAELEIKFEDPLPSMTFRVTELLTRDHGRWRVQAYQASQALPDKPDDWFRMQEMPVAGAHGTRGAALAGWLKHTATLAGHLHPGNDVIVLGSSSGERGAGAAGAKLLHGWRHLAFKVEQARQGGDGTSYAWVAARVSRRAKTKAGTKRIPYWAMILAVKGTAGWEVVSVHYSQDVANEGDIDGGGDPCGG